MRTTASRRKSRGKVARSYYIGKKVFEESIQKTKSSKEEMWLRSRKNEDLLSISALESCDKEFKQEKKKYEATYKLKICYGDQLIYDMCVGHPW